MLTDGEHGLETNHGGKTKHAGSADTGVRAEKDAQRRRDLLCPGLQGREMTEGWGKISPVQEVASWRAQIGRGQMRINAKRLSLFVGN